MQINLFKNDKVNRQYNRMGSQIFTRKYAVKHSEDLERFKTIKSENPRFLQYREDVLAALTEEKSMIGVSNLTADSYAKAEMLNIAEFNRKFVTVIDFSDALDAILCEILQCGCDQSLFRGIEDYSKISYALTNYKFNDVDGISLDLLFGIEPHLDTLIREIIASINKDHKDCRVDMQSMYFFVNFYSRLTDKLTSIENYVASVYKYECLGSDAVYRSKTFSKVILTSNVEVNGEIDVVGAYSKSTLPIRTYKPLEYAERMAEGEDVMEV